MSEDPANAGIGWIKLQSDNGQDYRVKATDHDISDAAETGNEPSPSGSPFNVDANWELGTEVSPGQELKEKTAVSWLTITTGDAYKYKFSTSEPNQYSLKVYQTSGTHILEFNSSKNTITSIAGN
ncbi:hypothetical protein FGRMN_292 [Fusarium graminum]|nr:hypothetical protein FGRMN_292 [Fusarium graminum]